MNTMKVLRDGLAIAILAFLGVLAMSKAAGARDYPQLEMRGPHGAFHIVNPFKADDSTTVNLNAAAALGDTRTTPVVVTRGSNGAAHLVNQKGVGGPEGRGVYPGFPKLQMRGPHGGFAIVD